MSGTPGRRWFRPRYFIGHASDDGILGGADDGVRRAAVGPDPSSVEIGPGPKPVADRWAPDAGGHAGAVCALEHAHAPAAQVTTPLPAPPAS